MLAPQICSSGLVRTLVLGFVGLPMLTLVGCNRDDLAPDCSLPDCSIPDPGGTAASIDCSTLPPGAVGATYNLDLSTLVTGGSGNFNMWEVTGLPSTLSVDAATGVVSGVPTEPMAYSGITISFFDAVKGAPYEATCGELVINESLNSNAILLEPNHCIPFDTPWDQVVALLDDGDGSPITCEPLNDGTGPCALGDGNGRIPPGIDFDVSSCSHTGSINTDRLGTWVWMVEAVQSDYSVFIPFCASNDVDTYHDVTLTVMDDPNADVLSTGILEYDPDQEVGFGGNQTYVWEVADPANCNGGCPYGLRFNFSCSPFDDVPPYEVTTEEDIPTGIGFTHELSATGPVPESKYASRPFTASFEMSYCTGDATLCNTGDGDQFEQNAQTRYHFSVIAYPTL